MPTFSSTKFRIKVLLVGRSDVITSHAYDNREAAEADLAKITEARKNQTEIELPWFQMRGALVQSAYVEDQSSSMSFA